MKWLLSLILLLSIEQANAALTSLHGMFGMQNSAMNLGAGVDYQPEKYYSFGGSLYYRTEKENVQRSGYVVDANMKIYFSPKGFKLYLAPGFGFGSFLKTTNAEENVIGLGPVFKVGALKRLAKGVYLGLEAYQFVNWTSDQTFLAGVSNVNFMLRFTL